MKKLLALLVFFISLPTVFSQNIQTKLLAKFDARLDAGDGYASGRLEFNPNGDAFFAFEDNQKLTVWKTGNRAPKFSLAGKFTKARFSPDGRQLAAIAKNSVTVADAESGEIRRESNKYKDEIKFLGWNPNSKNFAVGTKDFTVDILDVETGKIKNSVVVHEKKKSLVSRLSDGADRLWIEAAFTPDGGKMLTVCHDATAEFWDVETGKLVQTFTQRLSPPYQGALPKLPEVTSGKISGDGKWILTESYDDARLWSAETGELIEQFDGFGFRSFSPDSRFLGMVTDPTSKFRATAMFDLQRRKIKTFFAEYSGEISVWSPDSKTFMTDRTTDERSKNAASVWETETGKQKAALKTYSKGCLDLVSTCLSDFDTFSFSPNGEILMSQNKKQVKFLNPENGEPILVLDDAAAPSLWSPKGNYILAKTIEKGKIGLWEVTH